MESPVSYFARNFRYLRQRTGKTQTEIALAVRVSQQTIGNWENEVCEPAVNELVLINRYFGIDIRDLLFLDMQHTKEIHLVDQNGTELRNTVYYDPIVYRTEVEEPEPDKMDEVLNELKKIMVNIDELRDMMKGRFVRRK